MVDDRTDEVLFDGGVALSDVVKHHGRHYHCDEVDGATFGDFAAVDGTLHHEPEGLHARFGDGVVHGGPEFGVMTHRGQEPGDDPIAAAVR